MHTAVNFRFSHVFSKVSIEVIALLCLIVSSVATSSVARATALSTFETYYEVENDYITGGKATLRLAKDETRGYQFSLQTKPTGIFKWTKNGRIKEVAYLDSLEPPFVSSAYQYVDQGRTERSYQVVFNRSDGNFEIARQGTRSVHPVGATALDRLSVTLALLNQATTDAGFEKLEIDVLDGTETETVAYSNRGSERLTTEIGTFDAIRVLKDRVNSTRETVIWLAAIGEAKTVLPIQIEQYKKGKLSLRLKITGMKMLD